MSETDKGIEEAKEAIRAAVVDKTIEVALTISTTVILATPVDTGRARGNWIANINEAYPAAVDRDDKTGGETIAANTQIIVSAENIIDLKEIHITNNLPYIQRLNEGHSQQAPAGFIEKAVDVVRGL
jgi:hypothetical protein